MKYLVVGLVLCLSICLLEGASTQKADTTVATGTTKGMTTTPTGTTLSPKDQCAVSNGSCDQCVKVGNVQCVWCQSTKTCKLKEHLIPTEECSLADAKWAVCWVNYEALIIACSVVGGLLILGLTVCICCCCCCKKNRSAAWAKEDAKYERQKVERKAKSDERRAERKAKTDEIRRKYGLVKDDTPYTRFENN